MTLFRPCIDLHHGKVKQIVGASLSDKSGALRTNFESEHPAAYFAELYKKDRLSGGHVIMLGPGNEDAAVSALKAYPSGLQVGGGIHADNALSYLNAGATHVIITSWIFPNAVFSEERLKALVSKIGKERLVIDLSCKLTPDGWHIALDRWQTLSSFQITGKNLERLAVYCDEFLVHAADVEGLQQGMDTELIRYLAKHCPIPVTYAGGARQVEDLTLCKEISGGRVDLTIGSALDIFGGKGVRYHDCIEFNKVQR
ncbi:MAG: phosphoribosylformimino-5-aminoimidazole carboxamide ribotide isomerase [Fibrobacter sp.]|jgi:phosphoribosylformimino-5-aminoimidazole carboxamide ribotide isomerase|nr:phosphoribosylformimino-5-aminoimidazole carboxamide ribotide isomerase [Fibrobacter sp.]